MRKTQILKFPETDKDIWEREESYVTNVLLEEDSDREAGSPEFQGLVKICTGWRVDEIKKRGTWKSGS